MLFVGNARGGANCLANHLMNTRDNDLVTLAELRSFASDTLHEAFKEIYAISRGTKCRKYLYSLSINPPAHRNVSTEDFEQAIAEVEDRLGFKGHSRAIVYHEKANRRHCHVVWSRINPQEMKAVSVYRDRFKLMDISREMHIKRGWQMPKGLIDQNLTDPKNFSLTEWQQAKRHGKDPRAIKTALQDAWTVSDNRESFAHALKEWGYILARDRSRVLALDRFGEVYSVPKWVGLKAREIREKIGKPDGLPSLDEAKAQNVAEMSQAIQHHETLLDRIKKHRRSHLIAQRNSLITRHRESRAVIFGQIEHRRMQEVKYREARFRHGLAGLWDHVRGHNKCIRTQNEWEAWHTLRRDRAEKDGLILRQLVRY